MGFYIRKSVSAGPFRFNFSRGGVGVSVGVKRLRIGTGPRGHYIHAGTGGLYYRASLGNAGRRPAATAPQQRSTPPTQPKHSDVEMVEVESGDVMQMRDESFAELLDEMNAKSRQARMSMILCWIGIILGAFLGLLTGGPGLVLGLVAIPGWMIGARFDSYRRSTVLFYDLEGYAETAFNQLAKGFDGLKSCAEKWHIESGGAITNLTAWKRNAGASHLIKRKATTFAYSLPAVIKSNVTPPALSVGRQIMYFFPDVVLMQDGARIGAISYGDLQLRWQDSRFIEDGAVPSDARVVDHTWKHPNKSGGPDRRFKDNRQIPICLYEAMHLQSASGVNELVEFSQTGKAAAFSDRRTGGLSARGAAAIGCRDASSPNFARADVDDSILAVPRSASRRRHHPRPRRGACVGLYRWQQRRRPRDRNWCSLVSHRNSRWKQIESFRRTAASNLARLERSRPEWRSGASRPRRAPFVTIPYTAFRRRFSADRRQDAVWRKRARWTGEDLSSPLDLEEERRSDRA
ncbi:DUF4236 domain-containing protein [Rhizobium leguminosarum]|uniref:DUF4236 domain-containing protein n=1 Tax=Rhizobium leguminosarum TaxID=384 RepID=UPI001C967279|nr:DUF4236 domain-containing protein [Rhizobium leguminosarum]MBY5367827.1 DUF4236 domain-containing protein [Rhizobium leguminosarum]